MRRKLDQPLRIALYGRQGAGKTTSAQFIADHCSARELVIVRVRLADPLYRLQSALYAEAGRPLLDDTFQDSEVLAFLAAQLRRINPEALTSAAAEAVGRARTSQADVILCEDSRPPDRPSLEKLGFRFIHVAAPAQVCSDRRRRRGDASVCDEGSLHRIEGDLELTNDGSLGDFRHRWESALDDLIDHWHTAGALAA